MKAIVRLIDKRTLHIRFDTIYISKKSNVLFFECFKDKTLNRVPLHVIESIKVF